MATFKDRIFGQEVPGDIIDRFDLLQTGKSHAPLASVSKPYSHNLGESTAFARMWTAVDVITQGQLGPDGEVIKQNENGQWYYTVKSTGNPSDPIEDYDPLEEVHNVQLYSINENRVRSYTDNPLDFEFGDGKTRYVNQLRHNKLLKGSAGITSITSKTEGALGAVISTTVEFIVHNKRDFDEIILPFFLRPGSSVCVDFGREYLSGGGFELYDPIDYLKEESIDMEKFHDEVFKEESGQLALNFGSLETRMGMVTDYDMNINSEGSFVCSLEFSSENSSLIDRDIQPDNKLDYVFNNVLDTVLIEVLGFYQKKESIINIQEIFKKKDVYGEANLEKAITGFFEKAKVSTSDGTPQNMGKISAEASLTGIFHQNLTRWDNAQIEHDATTRAEKEKTYITLGRLEDLFLNNFVTGVVREEKFKEGYVFEKDPKNDYNIQYDSRKGLVRWDQLLFDLQSDILMPNEDLTDFIVPKDWTNSYNALNGKLITFDEEDLERAREYKTKNWAPDHTINMEAWESLEQQTFNASAGVEENSGDMMADARFPGIKVMPIRELFISTELIKSSFRENTTVDKALKNIVDTLNQQSANVWNIKITSSNKANTSFCFHDANLLAEQKRRLTFDVTSKDSIVSNCNIKFSKDTSLSNMITVSNLGEAQYIDQIVLGSISHLNSLNSKDGTFSKIRSLPFRGVANVNNDAAGIDIDPELLVKSIEKSPVTDEVVINTAENWNEFVNAKNAVILERQKALGNKQTNYQTETISTKDPIIRHETIPQGRGDRTHGSAGNRDALMRQTGHYAKSITDKAKREYQVSQLHSQRDVKLNELRKKYLGESRPSSIAPILPIELELTVYGNNYLQPGDLIDINYLPQHYKEKVMFQILEVEHKIEPNNWQTSYTSVMRFEPRFKFIAVGSENLSNVQFTTDARTHERDLIPEDPKEEEVIEIDDTIIMKDDKDEVIADPVDTDETIMTEAELEGRAIKLEPVDLPKKQRLGQVVDLGIINKRLQFKVHSQEKFPLENENGYKENEIRTWNHGATIVSDIEKLSNIKNLAYLAAIKYVIFEHIFHQKDFNVNFDRETLQDPKYDKENFKKLNKPLDAIVEGFNDEDTLRIVKLYPGDEETVVNGLNMIGNNFVDTSIEYADQMKNLRSPIFSNGPTFEIQRFPKKIVFIANDGDENGNPDTMYYFRNQNELNVLQLKKEPAESSIAIPKSILDRAGLSYEQFGRKVEEQYNMYLETDLINVGRAKPKPEEKPEPKIFISYARPAETEAPSGAIIEEPGSLQDIKDRNGKTIGPLFLVYRIGNSEGTFDNLTDRNTFYAKTLATIEVEGKPPSDPILVEGQTRKRLVDRRGVQLYVLKQNSVTAAILQARKEARKRKNS